MAGYQMNGLVPFNNFNGLVPQLISQQYLSQQNNPANGPTIEKIAGKNLQEKCTRKFYMHIFGKFIKIDLDAILEARYGSISGHRKQRRSRTAFSAQQLQALERAFETTQVQ